MNNLTLKIDDKIAILEFNQPDSKVNVLNTASMKEFYDIINQIEKKGPSEVEALVITSAKEDIFIAGADIKEIEGISSPEEALLKAEQGKEVLAVLEKMTVPTMAVINGACLGGGLELALACRWRVAGFGEKVKLGLPEVNLGLVPGFGGCVRLPRLVGLTRALMMILPGRAITAKDALKYGLVDKLFPDIRLTESAVEFARVLLNGGGKIKRGKKKKLIERFLEDTPPGRAVLCMRSRKDILKKTKAFYPAPLEALKLITRTYGRGVKKAFRLESEVFSRLAVTEVTKNLIKVFYLNEEFKKFQWVEKETEPIKINKCAVLGAGVMGGGIAQLVSFKNIPTRLKDIGYEPLKQALKTAYGLFEYAVKKKKIRPNQADFKFTLISPTLSYQGFANADLVIEAVVEDMAVKEKVFNELNGITRPEAILVSNTSALSISKMARQTSRPERAAGLHFFNPVHRMPLVEVVKTEMTSDQTLATVIAFARRLGKVVIVVKDVPGFLINRILMSYLNEAGFLIEEGLAPRKVDRLARSFGMPMGPVELVEKIGMDVAHKVAKILEASYGERMKVSQKRGRSPKGSVPTRDEALKRMVYVMINEAARCLEEGVVASPGAIDIGMIMGTGFPPFRGGLLRYADSAGIGSIVKDLKEFETKYKTPRFTPCKYLLAKAEKNEKFY